MQVILDRFSFYLYYYFRTTLTIIALNVFGKRFLLSLEQLHDYEELDLKRRKRFVVCFIFFHTIWKRYFFWRFYIEMMINFSSVRTNIGLLRSKPGEVVGEPQIVRTLWHRSWTYLPVASIIMREISHYAKQSGMISRCRLRLTNSWILY